MKFALITADKSHSSKFYLNPERDDVTSFFQWISIFDGIHLSYHNLREEDNSYLKDFDVVMLSGHLNYMSDIVRIGKFLKDSNTITMFYPEGSAQLYDNSINGYHKEYYDAWNACDIFSAAEEDKISYYKAFVSNETLVKFIHVPITREMEESQFMVPRFYKSNGVMVYGDNNPNHPLIAMACAKNMKSKPEIIGVDLRRKEYPEVFNDTRILETTKLAAYPYMRLFGRSIVHFYPTEWIGTARQVITCAATGTPCIGNRDSHTQQRLFPELGKYIYDIDGMVELADRLCGDEKFYCRIVDQAFHNMQFYNLQNTTERFMSAVNEAADNKKKRIAV